MTAIQFDRMEFRTVDASQKDRHWDDFTNHVNGCSTCSANPLGFDCLCGTGKQLLREWEGWGQ